MLFEVAANATAAGIRIAAPGIKSIAFANEEEWRLITYEVNVNHNYPKAAIMPLNRNFRATNDRVIPYLEYSLPLAPVTEIVLGASSPMKVEEPALAILLRETAPGQSVSISRSTVPIRP